MRWDLDPQETTLKHISWKHQFLLTNLLLLPRIFCAFYWSGVWRRTPTCHIPSLAFTSDESVCNVAGSLEVNLFTSPEATGLDVCYCGCYSVLPLSQTDFPSAQILIGSADSWQFHLRQVRIFVLAVWLFQCETSIRRCESGTTTTHAKRSIITK